MICDLRNTDLFPPRTNSDLHRKLMSASHDHLCPYFLLSPMVVDRKAYFFNVFIIRKCYIYRENDLWHEKTRVQIDAQLNWKRRVEYTCKKLSKCIGILAKARKVLYKSCLINLYYTFAYPYFIYCNQMWGNAYQTNLEKIVLVQKRLIRLITGSPYRAHTEPLLFVANRILTFKEINEFTIGVFMYKSQNGDLPEIFDNYYQTHGDIHGRETRNAVALYVPYGRHDIRRTSISIYGADVWNSIPTHIQSSESIEIFKRRLRCHLIDRKLHVLI